MRRQLSDISYDQSRAALCSYLLVLVEYLHPHKGVENQSRQLIMFTYAIIRKNRDTTKVQDESNRELVERLANYHLPHRQRDQRR